MQALHNLVVPQGAHFSVYIAELRLLLAKVRRVGHVAPEDGTMQIAVNTGIDDQFTGLRAQIFTGRNVHALQFDTVPELMGTLEDLSLNQIRAAASVRIGGTAHRPVTRSQSYAQQQCSGQKLHRAVQVKTEDYEDQGIEFTRVHTSMLDRRGFGKNSSDPPFYVCFRQPRG